MIFLNSLKIVPLVSYGRSGSTVCMKLLKAIGCAVHGDPPYEDRSCQMSFLSHLTNQSGLESIIRSDIRVSEVISKMPFYNSHLIPSGDMRIRELFNEFIDFTSSISALGKPAIAEKFIGIDLLQSIAGYFPDGQFCPVYLQRDPRDIFLSVKEFNLKRGFHSFNDNGDDSQLYRVICWYSRQMQSLSGNGSGFQIYYEDLVNEPEHVIRSVCTFIGIELNDAVVSNALNAIQPSTAGDKAHMTSNDVSSTVGKWKLCANLEYSEIFTRWHDKLSPILRYATET